ncbi:hypothetical protein [Hymenobacter weizhouensis]|uniref:hypothetical protein n=1 Tax=Hymenobacter sp. YIM 151500-1 TaxID=2987689 RepID=UPI0022266633|nr:hypothetical protein [Hymenobacter sp. YIM 151500-1]UYZ63705.1 hypothetical protein OIS53_02410 [Hymenobacter sp. YIM 151500-1]
MDNAAALEAKSHTPADTEQLRTLHQPLMQDNTAQDESQPAKRGVAAGSVSAALPR